MGDIIQDSLMIDDTDYKTILKIGFLNELTDDEKLQRYLKAYDLVIADDGSMCPVL